MTAASTTHPRGHGETSQVGQAEFRQAVREGMRPVDRRGAVSGHGRVVPVGAVSTALTSSTVSAALGGQGNTPCNSTLQDTLVQAAAPAQPTAPDSEGRE